MFCVNICAEVNTSIPDLNDILITLYKDREDKGKEQATKEYYYICAHMAYFPMQFSDDFFVKIIQLKMGSLLCISSN